MPQSGTLTAITIAQTARGDVQNQDHLKAYQNKDPIILPTTTAPTTDARTKTHMRMVIAALL